MITQNRNRKNNLVYEGRFMCYECGTVFVSTRYLHAHIKNVHVHKEE